MKLAIIGMGQAGGKVVDKFLWYDQQTPGTVVRSAIVINTAETDLRGLQRVPEANQMLIGQSHVKGHGVGADNELGAQIAEENRGEIQQALDAVPVHEIDGFLIVAGLGGGTGSGGAPVVARHLKRIYSEPVYGLGVLPASDEGGIYSLNAARSLETLVGEVDNLLIFDNDAWRETGESLGAGYESINEEIAKRFGVLFSAGEVRSGGTVAESVVDSSEIINTLAGGGISSVGYAAEALESADEGLLSRFQNDDPIGDSAATTNRVTSLVRKAALGRLTLPCDLDGTERALVVVSGPPEELNRKGLERGRRWLEEETGSMEVRGGDYPLSGEKKLAAVVVLGGVTKVPRIKELQRVAVEAQENQQAIRERSEEQFDELINGGVEGLDPLF